MTGGFTLRCSNCKRLRYAMIRALTSVGGRNAEHRYQLEWPGSGDHRDLRYRHRCPGSYHLTTQCERGRLFSCQPLDALADDRAGVANRKSVVLGTRVAVRLDLG